MNKVKPSPIRCLFTGVWFFEVVPDVVGFFVTVPVDVVVPLDFGSVAVEGLAFGLRRLVLGGVFVFVAGFSLDEIRETHHVRHPGSTQRLASLPAQEMAPVKRACYSTSCKSPNGYCPAVGLLC